MPNSARDLPGVVAVWTADDIADVPPIDFREGPIEKLAPYRQPVLAQHKVRYVGEPIAVVFAEDPYVAEDAADIVTMEVEELPVLLDARDDARRVLVCPRHRGDGAASGLRRRGGRVQVRAAYRRAEAHQRPALRRAAGDPGSDRPLRRLARRAGAARRRQGAAPEQGADRAHAQPRAVVGAVLRIPCRRRLRHPRRDLSRGHPGLRRGDALRAPGEVDRGPPRASDRGQSLAPPAPPHQGGGAPTTAKSSPSTT